MKHFELQHLGGPDEGEFILIYGYMSCYWELLFTEFFRDFNCFYGPYTPLISMSLMSSYYYFWFEWEQS